MLPIRSIRYLKRDRRPLEANARAVKGEPAACDLTTGFYGPAAYPDDMVYVGRFTETVDNTGGGHGDKSAEIEFLYVRQLVLFKNHHAAPVLCVDRESICFFYDNEAVGTTHWESCGNKPRHEAGCVYDVISEGRRVWVDITHAPTTEDLLSRAEDAACSKFADAKAEWVRALGALVEYRKASPEAQPKPPAETAQQTAAPVVGASEKQ